VGSHLVEALLARGYRVRCLVRRSSNLSFIEALPVDMVVGSLSDEASLEQACRGVDAVFHAAGATKAADADTLYQVNADGTAALLNACCRVNPGVRRFVFLSSLAASGPAKGSLPVDETWPERPVSDYGASKLAGEESVRGYAGQLPIVILRAAPIYGPRERDILAYFRLVQHGLRLLPGGGAHQVSLIHVDDVVGLALQVLENDCSMGQTYIAGDGEAYDLDAVLKCIAEVLGRRTLRITVPMALLEAFATVGGVWARRSGHPTLISKDKLQEMKQPSWLCDPGKARRELGFVCQVDLRSGLARTARWYQQQGWL
jgi:nucleoside-diphosphate-sugar epimerase